MKSIINKTTIFISLAVIMILSSTAVRAEYRFDAMRPNAGMPAVYSQVIITHARKNQKIQLTKMETALAERAVLSCTCAIKTPKLAKKSVQNAKRLLRIEKEMKIPKLMFGMTLSAACSESCFRENAKGDYKWGKNGKAKAHGIFQLWPWAEKYGVDRMNLESSTRFWLRHIKNIRKKTLKFCKPRSYLLSWRQAWVTAIRYPKRGGRCNEIPKHWTMFLKILKMKKQIRLEFRGVV